MMIRPSVSGDLLEISLGGTPRGLVVLLADPSLPEVDLVEAMNHFALEGYESLATVSGSFLSRVADRGWSLEQTGVVGLGAGATTALSVALSVPVGAVVSFSPATSAPASALVSPWLGLFGGLSSSPAEVRALRASLREGSDVFSEVVTYAGVAADFHRRSETGVGFAASYDGWQRATEWLNVRVASRLTPLAEAWRRRTAG